VVVLEAGPVPARDFAGWSMAYAGRRQDLRFEAFAGSPEDISPAMLDLLRGALRQMAGTVIPA
jgi:hypothetical protein